MNVSIVGRFPPPIDGQSLATQRLAELLEPSYHILRIDTQPDSERVRREEGLTLGRIGHVFSLRTRIRRRLDGETPGVALWPAISPDAAGHFRDRLAVLPAMSTVDHVVAVVHRGNFDKLFSSGITSRSARRIVKRISRFVFLSTELAARCARWIPPHKRRVIPNTIDDALLFSAEEVAARQALQDDRDQIQLLFVGNMIEEKGYLDVLGATAILRNQGVPVRLRFAGRWLRPEDETRFRQVVHEQALENVVEHKGPVPNRDAIKSLYREADLVLLPSYYPNEAQPLVILEALNAGVPVIATRHGGIPEIIPNEEGGYLVPARDPASLAEHVLKASEPDRWLNLSRAARRRFTSTYAPEPVRCQWLDLIEELRQDRS